MLSISHIVLRQLSKLSAYFSIKPLHFVGVFCMITTGLDYIGHHHVFNMIKVKREKVGFFSIIRKKK
jgi:hypothetical protein